MTDIAKKLWEYSNVRGIKEWFGGIMIVKRREQVTCTITIAANMITAVAVIINITK